MPKAKAEGVELEQGTHVLKGHSFIARFLVKVNPYDDQTPVQACHHLFVSRILQFGFMLSISIINDVAHVCGKQNLGKEGSSTDLFLVYHIIKLLKFALSYGYSNSNLIGRSTIAWYL